MQSAEPTGGLILVVDDDHHNLFVVQRRLESFGFNVITASSGKKAIEVAENQKPDLILLDVTMPEMDGFEVKRVLASSDVAREIPVIFLSSRVQIEFKVEAFQLGAEDFIAKPYHADELLARVRVATRHRAEVQELRDEIDRLNLHLRGGGLDIASEEEAVERLDRSIQVAESRRDPLACINLKINGIQQLASEGAKRVVLMETGEVLQEMVNAKTDAVLAFKEEGEYLLFTVGMTTKRAQILAEGLKSSVVVRAFADPQAEQALTVSIGISGREHGSTIAKEEILAAAGRALEQAIAAGGSRIVVARAGE
ncbi:response regulator [Candidatus Poribacteria bacterium]|nr:response regulator [Candidatus Poribacteria bacterium]